MGKPADYVQFRPIGALKNQMGAAKQHMISAKSFWRTALKDHQATIVAAPQSPGSLGVPQKAPGLCGGNGSGSTQLSAWQPHRWQPAAAQMAARKHNGRTLFEVTGRW